MKVPVVEVESTSQLAFSIEIETRPKQTAPTADSNEVVFKEPDPKKIFLGSQCIDTHLQNAGIKAPGVIRNILDALDWSGFIKLYKPKGRKAYHPRLMMGIILYGVTKGVSSLRGLEQLARTDIGCMWVGSGICPDHSILGRFINKHSQQITDEFFISLSSRF